MTHLYLVRRTRTPLYYKVRTLVRAVFWTLVVYGVMLSVAWFSQLGQRPECPVVLNEDFTYTPTGTFVLGECSGGPNVTLYGNNTWGWTE